MDADTGLAARRAPARRAVISPLLANIYLDPLDKLMAARGFRMVRYADDFVILCRTREDADAALAEVRAWVEANGLTLHPRRRMSATAGCRGKGSSSSATGSKPAGASCARRAWTSSRTPSERRRDATEATASSASSPISTGRCAAGSATSSMPIRTSSNPSTDRSGVGCARCCSSREKRSHIGQGLGLSRLWPNAYFAEHGLFALHAAWAAARQSR